MLARLYPAYRGIRSYSIMASASKLDAARDFLSFVNASPTPFHAVQSVKDRLVKAGFKEIKVHMPDRRRRQLWTLC